VLFNIPLISDILDIAIHTIILEGGTSGKNILFLLFLLFSFNVFHLLKKFFRVKIKLRILVTIFIFSILFFTLHKNFLYFKAIASACLPISCEHYSMMAFDKNKIIQTHTTPGHSHMLKFLFFQKQSDFSPLVSNRGVIFQLMGFLLVLILFFLIILHKRVDSYAKVFLISTASFFALAGLLEYSFYNVFLSSVMILPLLFRRLSVKSFIFVFLLFIAYLFAGFILFSIVSCPDIVKIASTVFTNLQEMFSNPYLYRTFLKFSLLALISYSVILRKSFLLVFAVILLLFLIAPCLPDTRVCQQLILYPGRYYYYRLAEAEEVYGYPGFITVNETSPYAEVCKSLGWQEPDFLTLCSFSRIIGNETIEKTFYVYTEGKNVSLESELWLVSSNITRIDDNLLMLKVKGPLNYLVRYDAFALELYSHFYELTDKKVFLFIGHDISDAFFL
jgi:hypothetical protein